MLALPVNAVVDVREFDSEEARARYYKFIEELRCPKCKNQNLAGSNSPIALDLRRELHRLIDEGKSDDEIVDFMVSRFGDFVLYRPPVQENTYLLWAAPFIMGFVGLSVLSMIVIKRRPKVATVNSEDNPDAKVEELLKKIDQNNNEA